MKNEISGVLIDSVNDIELIAISMERMSEVEEYLGNASLALESKDYQSAIGFMSFAEVRLKTVKTWLSVLDFFSDGLDIEFDPDRIGFLSQQRIEQARNSITYAQTVTIGGFLIRAEEFLNRAENSFSERNYIHALFQSLYSRALAELAMETRGVSEIGLRMKLDRKIGEAQRTIQQTESRGVLPLLAISYLEYSGGLLESGDITSALMYASYSKEFATISSPIISNIKDGFVFEEEEVFIRPVQRRVEFGGFTYLVLGLILGFFLAKKIM